MTTLRRQRRFPAEVPPIWTRHQALCRADWPPQYVVWEGALEPILGSARLPDRRGIVLGSEEALHRRSRFILGWVGDMLGLRHTAGWGKRPPAFISELMTTFYAPFGHHVAWVMVESCRDTIRNRHPSLREHLYPYTRPTVLLPAPKLRRAELSLEARVRIPARRMRFALPDGRSDTRAGFVRTEIERHLRLAQMTLTGQITCWCVAHAGEDDADLAKGFVPSGLQCRLLNGVNEARLITWFRMDPKSGFTETYAVDIDPGTGQLLSLRYQQASLRMMVEMDPWLDDWLLSALRYF